MDVSKKTINLAEVRYKISDRFPKEERFVVTSQIPLAAASVASNISEDHLKRHGKFFV